MAAPRRSKNDSLNFDLSNCMIGSGVYGDAEYWRQQVRRLQGIRFWVGHGTFEMDICEGMSPTELDVYI